MFLHLGEMKPGEWGIRCLQSSRNPGKDGCESSLSEIIDRNRDIFHKEFFGQNAFDCSMLVHKRSQKENAKNDGSRTYNTWTESALENGRAVMLRTRTRIRFVSMVLATRACTVSAFSYLLSV